MVGRKGVKRAFSLRILAFEVILTMVLSSQLLVAPHLARAQPAQCRTVRLSVSLEPSSPTTHNVIGTLCRLGGSRRPNLQILLSGATYGREYWDFRCDLCVDPDRYSYLKATTSTDWATLNLDRIGIGDSDHPPDEQISLDSESFATHQIIQRRERAASGTASDTGVWSLSGIRSGPGSPCWRPPNTQETSTG